MSWIFRSFSLPLLPSVRRRGVDERRLEAIARAFDADLRQEFRAACEHLGVRTKTHVPAGVTIRTPRVGTVHLGPPTRFSVELMPGFVPADLLPPARRVAQAVGGGGVRLEPLAGRWLQVAVLDGPDPPADHVDPLRRGPRRVPRRAPVAAPCPSLGAVHSFR